MSKDKNQKPKEPTELEKKVDQMMDTHAKSAEAVKDVAPSDQQEPPAIDIFKDAKTAPKVSPSLLKEIGIEQKSTKNQEDTTVPTKDEKPKDLEKTEEQQPADEQEVVTPEIKEEEPFADKATDEAVDEIAAEESDKVIENEDANNATATISEEPKKKGHKFKRLLKSKKFWITFILILVIVFGVPYTRYKAIGLVYKAPVTMTVTDSVTHSPVSNAEIDLHGSMAKTDGNGVAKFKAKPGNDNLKITKQYYKTYNQKQMIGLRGNKSLKVSVTATGRQVPITILNTITGEPLKNAEIKVGDSTAKTDSKGRATLVIPASKESKKATITLEGYNTLESLTLVTEKQVPQNVYTLTPKGKIYFLSNLNGTIDVVKSDLDGKNRETVLKGTGKEDRQTTSLLASRDWKYIALKVRRDTVNESLYIIDTTNGDKLTRFDSGATTYNLVGWYDHNFVYKSNTESVKSWQNGRQLVKSYNAERSTSNLLDQSQAGGTSTNYREQEFTNFYILENQVVYTVEWTGYNESGEANLSGKFDSIRSVSPSGQNKKDVKTFSATTTSYIQASHSEPEEIYYAIYTVDGKSDYYKYEDSTVTHDTSLTDDDINKDYPTFLISPGGDTAFWADFRDGKNTLFVGKENDIESKTQIASLSDYAPYGFYTDNYLLLTKNSSELYVTTQKQLQAGKKPFKTTDYYKPKQSYQGYGYGYGGGS